MTFLVTWPRQTASGNPPEAYLTESAAAQRAADLVALGQTYACYFEVADERHPTTTDLGATE